MQKKKAPFRSMTTQTLTYCAMLAALSIAFARLTGFMPSAASRYSIEQMPIFLAGMLFGPLPGALVGFVADSVGCLFSGFGYNPIFCIPPILYGLFGGLFRAYLTKGVTLPRLVISFLPPVVLGSVLYQSAALAYVYNGSTFWESFLLKLSTRGIQFSITLVVDVLLIWLLFRTGIFQRTGLWQSQPSKSSKQRNDDHECQ